MIALKHDSDPMGNPVKALHLEDSEIDHLLLKRAVSASGLLADYVRVDSQETLVEALQSQTFDIVLMDFRLPGFTALEAWDHIRQDPQHAPCVIVSGAIGEEAAVGAIQNGISDYLHKDRISEIGRVIRRAIRVHQLEVERSDAEIRLKLSEQKTRELAQHLQTSVEEERTEISREIHDEIGGSLTALKLDLGRIKRHTTDDLVRQRLVGAEEILNQALTATQRIMQNTRPAILDQGLTESVQWLLDGYRRRTGWAASLNCELSNSTISDAIRLTAYRVVQESLTNVTKYAASASVNVEISDSGDVLTVEVKDTGPGFDTGQNDIRKGFGLKGLKERAHSVGGWLDVSSALGRGTTISLTVPLGLEPPTEEESPAA